MAVEIAFDPKQEVAVMWDNTTDTAFGPVFSGPSADSECQEFIDWLRQRNPLMDVREYTQDDLVGLAWKWSNLPTLQP